MKKIIKWFEEKHIILCILLAFLLNILIEIFGRRSIVGGFEFLFNSPIIFFYNMLIIFFTLILSILFKRRIFTVCLISTFWLSLGITNCVVLGFRTTPLGAIDFKIVKSAIDIMPVYLNVLEIILIICVIVMVVALLIYAFIKLPKHSVKYLRAIMVSCVVFVSTLLATVVCLNLNIVSSTFKNIGDAYRDYGFSYCFSCTLLFRGIDKPDDYSQDTMKEIISEIDEKEKDLAQEKYDALMALQNKEEYLANKEHPNIIFLQLESFFDVNHLKNVTFSQDPVPIFRHLKKTYSSGFLTVPTVGAGTANTEFEIITGMSLQFFGPGEYPYTTILKTSTCETLNYNLKELGYKTHAIHNHKGTFYDRNIVYSQLGFDTFTSIEYMNNIQLNPIGWAKDSILPYHIIDTLDSTRGRDLIYTISVQGHGKYPSEVVDETQQITEEGFDEANKIGFEYFINQLNEMDRFIGSLISTLENYDEPVVLVMYGDHLPAFDIKNEELDNEDIFQTEYVIWNNIDIPKEDKDIYSYQLSADVFERLGIDNGVLTKFHKLSSKNENYLEELEMLEHDMLYGEKVIYNGKNPYEPTKLQMGVAKINIYSVSQIENTVYILGKDFTKYSELYVNGKKKEIEYKDRGIIIVPNVELNENDIITVLQVTDDNIILSTTDEYIYHAKVIK